MSDDTNDWYVRDAENVAGPFSRAELERRYRQGELDWYHEVSQDHLIWVSVTSLHLSDAGGLETEVGRKSLPRRRKSWPGIVIVVASLLGLIGVGWLFLGMSQGTPEETEAILRVLIEDERVSKSTVHSVAANQTPSAYARAINEYVGTMAEMDISDCPPEFRVAFRHHLGAWLELRDAVRVLPETFLEGFFVGTINGYLYGEKDGGLSRMAATIQEASQNVKFTYEEVEEIALKYNAALP